ncbi:MAG: hypothetical protein ACYTEQ_19700 [Planctomycetota bacterium]
MRLEGPAETRHRHPYQAAYFKIWAAVMGSMRRAFPDRCNVVQDDDIAPHRTSAESVIEALRESPHSIFSAESIFEDVTAEIDPDDPNVINFTATLPPPPRWVVRLKKV